MWLGKLTTLTPLGRKTSTQTNIFWIYVQTVISETKLYLKLCWIELGYKLLHVYFLLDIESKASDDTSGPQKDKHVKFQQEQTGKEKGKKKKGICFLF